MKTKKRLFCIWLSLATLCFINAGCRTKTITDNKDVQVFDSAHVAIILANAMKIEPIGMLLISKTESWVRTTQYYKVTVALDKDNHLIHDPNKKGNEAVVQNAEKRIVVVNTSCSINCLGKNPATGEIECPDASCCVPDKRAGCSPVGCGNCKTTQPCRAEKSGFGIGENVIIF